MTSIGLLFCLLPAIAVEFCFIALLLTVHVSSRSRMTAHMEPHPAREWIQMTPMDMVNVEVLLYCLLVTVHVSSRSRMTAHMEPHPAREWIQMTPMDIINITDDGSYGTTPSQGMDPDDTNGHR
eukprot:scaffold23711_cov34-Attheya_sp.AAC.4